MTKRQRQDSATEPTAARTAAGRALSPVTASIIAMSPGDRLDVTPRGYNIDTERARMGSRFRTATLQTGHRYSVYTQGGRLYVECRAA